MKKVLLILTCLVSSLQTIAADCYDNCCSDTFGFESALSIDIGGGYRQDTLQWNTYPVSAPGTYVKEKWKNLSMGIVETNIQFLALEHYLLKVDFDYGWIAAGNQSVLTKDLYDDVLTQKVNSKTGGRAYDLSGAIGYQFDWCCYHLSFAPLVGYSYSFQKFKNSKYHNDLATDLSEFAKNNYKYRWRGPWLGFAVAYQLSCECQVYVDYAYHWSRYRAKVRENFAFGELPSHQKSNRAHGNEVVVGSTYNICDNWFVGLKFDWKEFSSEKGTFSNKNGAGADDHSPLRNLKWTSWFIAADIGYVF